MIWPIVITLHGDSGSGKDSTYQALQTLKYNLPRVSFGDMLRQDIYETYGVERMTDAEERELIKPYHNPLTGENESMSFKDLMLVYGRAMILENPFRYPERIAATIQKATQEYGSDVVVVTDARRPHELAAIRESYRTYSFRVFYKGSTRKALDRVLDGDKDIFNLKEGSSPESNANQIIDHMIRVLPRYPQGGLY